MKKLTGTVFLVATVGPWFTHRVIGRTDVDADGTTAAPAMARESITIGSKKFTESVILGEMAAQLVRSIEVGERRGITVRHRQELGGTRILWNALLVDQIDLYPEYTGTLSQEILADEHVHTEEQIREALARRGVSMTRPLGFNNTYGVGMKGPRARELGVRTISDLRDHPDLRLGFTNEFMDREDGWPRLRDRYRLPQRDVRGLDHDLAYRALDSGAIDAMDVYTTDAEIVHYGLTCLRDDLSLFPAYEAVYLFKTEFENREPAVVRALRVLEGRVSAPLMIAMNRRAKIDKVSERRVAADFLKESLGMDSSVEADGLFARFWRHTRAHLFLVGVSMAAAILIALPLGVWAAKFPTAGQVILGTVGIVQTIPSLALLVFMIPFLGIGEPAAIVALFLYSLLPIIRNVYTGLHDISPDICESACAIGLSSADRLRLIELPMASRAILAGIKTSTVINIGTATLGALIGAGGYGQPILTGIRLDDTGLILQGAIPAAGLALVAQGFFELAERVVLPKGLRL